MRQDYSVYRASLIAQLVKNLPAVQETPVQFLGWEDPLEKEKATHSSILAWRIPWTVLVHGISESDTTERLSLIQFMVPQPTLESTGRLLSGGLVARAWPLLSQGSQEWGPEESGADTAPAQLRCGLLAGTPGPGLRFTL